MDIKRLWNSFRLCLISSGSGRADYIRKKGLFGSMGNQCILMKRKLPLYANLIHIHDNVKIASNVGFVTHDIIYSMMNARSEKGGFVERIGCIEIMDNVFIGSGTRILYDTRIGSNVIIGSGSFVNRDVPDNSVYAGVPAQYICSFEEYMDKARDYSCYMEKTYGIKRLRGVNDKLAQDMYLDFLRARGSDAMPAGSLEETISEKAASS